MIYFTKPSGRVKQANPVFAPPRASNWLASLAVIGLFASPAYGQTPVDEQVDTCATNDRATTGEIGGGCQLQYSTVNDDEVKFVKGEDAVPATYRITINGVEYAATGSITPDGVPDVLQLVTADPSDSDGDGSPATVTFNYEKGAVLELVILTDGEPAVDEVTAVPATTTDTAGNDGTAVGSGAIVKGIGSAAIGNGAIVGINIEGTPAVTTAVPGTYVITIDGVNYAGTGTISPGDGTPDVLTLTTPQTTDTDGDGSLTTATFQDGEGDTLRITVVVAPIPVSPRIDPSITAVAYGTAVGVNTKVVGNGGVALGSGATAGANGIAIGSRVTADGSLVSVTAGANQIRIGGTQTDVRVGVYDLSGLAQIPQIAVNTDDIETNRAGVASAIAMANLPSVQGPKGGWSLALGSFDSETAIAGGINFDVFTSSIVKISVASSGGETSAGVGFGMGF